MEEDHYMDTQVIHPSGSTLRAMLNPSDHAKGCCSGLYLPDHTKDRCRCLFSK